jgi:hypothetical protein
MHGLTICPITKELWPLIVAKAICTLTALTFDTRPQSLEFGHASILQMLTGVAFCCSISVVEKVYIALLKDVKRSTS